ncbi:MAG TPA: hypothetical protein VHG72_04085 [Polyangia bacterium]|nr:hypothetical protein [Polyangia bacterium]
MNYSPFELVHRTYIGRRRALCGLPLLLASCAGVTPRSVPNPDSGTTVIKSRDAGALDRSALPDRPASPAFDAGGPTPLTDFPPDPIVADPNVPANASTLFGGTPRADGAPCIVSPEPNTLMPRNWLRPQFQYNRAADENLYEIDLSVAGFAHSLTIYTTLASYTLDPTIWDGLRVSINDQPISVSIRALTLSGTGTLQNPPSQPALSSFTIAPVDAPGKIVYWAIPQGNSDGILRGFGIGEESVETVLTGPQVQPPASSATLNDGCIGCHSATPDGLSVGFAFGPHDNNGDTYYDTIVSIESPTVGVAPSYVTPGQLATIRALRGIPAYSKSHWMMGDHMVLLMDGQNHGDLLWVQLDADGQQGTIMRSGDSNGATEPTFSHDGTQIAYVSTQSIVDGRLANGPADLYLVPYGNRAGGAATPIAGASDSAFTEYYPAFSPDDLYLTFTRYAGNGSAYSNNQAEIFVVASGGGTVARLGANDPPACETSVHSPGVTNDWSKWSPEATTAANGKTYYWMTFSSTRSGRPQLYIAPMTVSAGTIDVSYPALYLWNQPSTDDNHTPSWDDYQIPSITID